MTECLSEVDYPEETAAHSKDQEQEQIYWSV